MKAMRKVALAYPVIYEVARFNEKRKEFPPFGVLSLASVLRKDGYDVDLVAVSKGSEIKDFRRYDAVGFSIASTAAYSMMQKSASMSAFAKGVFTMAGGCHASHYPVETMLDMPIDAICIGEGEETILDMMKYPQDLSRLPGVCYKEGDEPRLTQKRTLMRDINALPLPSRHLLPAKDVVMENRLCNLNIRICHIMFSRGCPYACRFCAYTQKVVQYRNATSIREELCHLKRQYGIEGFSIVDDNSILNKRGLRDILESIEDLGMKWNTLARVDTVDEDILRQMRAAGCVEIKYGMESGSQRILSSMDKGITTGQIARAVEMAHAAGLSVKLFVIHGYPGENRETTQDTMNLLDALGSAVRGVNLFRFVPLPGSYVYNHAEDFRIHGTHLQSDWDGDWDKFHIYHNDAHWWGDETDRDTVNASYAALNEYVAKHYH
jgi:radical SAM superfamily enzyme YgiQ (UPF0313 family)